MAATAAMRTQLRRMTQEPTTRHYSDADLDTIIEQYPLHDLDGNSPWTEDTDGATIVNPDWTATYDLHAAAAEIWLQKAGRIAEPGVANALDALRLSLAHGARRAARSTAVTPVDDPSAEDLLP